MRVLITGGGTGGHIYPALAIAKKMKKEINDIDLLYVGTEHGMEADIIPREGFKFKTIRVEGFRRKLSLGTIKTINKLFVGMNDARKIVNNFKPDIVIGTGGYVCGPIVMTAALKKIPTVIHEQNAFPGVTNRILSRFVKSIACSFEESSKFFKNKEKIVVTGNPVRESFFDIDKEKAYKKLNINPNKKFVLSIGGSGGQKSLNQAMVYVIKRFNKHSDIQLIHVTGKRHYDNFIKLLKDEGINNINKSIRIMPYLFDMPEATSLADLVITSSGAITIAEVTAVGAPTLLIPKGYTTENHQEYNARALEQKKASVVLLEKELTGEVLYKKIDALLKDEVRLKEMSEASKKLGKKDSIDEIYNLILKHL
ncbi:undecaprenyldiphospho-muramoylpentapeptide beta-N-acetylglucosaminyltransferase [Abyssisolibacter fermentans]|uniref:undecaprenyldiphospho-muramoylpentapeptide beta-N-acetylglucosaminyltransferase n=1 Tax=Abyssisolibacter fermentans TaxID=1766203 RepID=UPI00082F08EE|nr:undecaprenyldiphospho-muramoylpentapeptide beta-N-acetylglucosaminyltransferase [Abyssisolibacter fermentans]